jgi:hypothetical protein
MSDYEPIQVMRCSPKGRRGPFPGIRAGRVAAYEFPMFDVPVREGQLPRDRSYLLLDEGIQMSCPPGFLEHHAGWWYVDLVEITEQGTEVTVMDQYLDLVVGPPDHPYRVLDMDEFGEALASGELAAEKAVEGLRNFQRFIDLHLNRLADAEQAWPDFPPRAMRELVNWKTELFPDGAPAVFWDLGR